MNQRLADGDDQVVLAVRFTLEGALEEQDTVGQRVAVVPAAFGKRRALVQSEQRIGRLDVHLFEQLVRRFVLDDDREVGHGVAKAPRNRRERVSDETLELCAPHVTSRVSSAADGPAPPRRTGSSYTRPAPRTDRTTASVCRCGGHAG